MCIRICIRLCRSYMFVCIYIYILSTKDMTYTPLDQVLYICIYVYIYIHHIL